MIVTCRTPGCGNADQPIDLQFTDPETGDPVVPDSYVCGVCGQTIGDLVDPADLLPTDDTQDPPGE
jgi:hypothetical protein